MRYLIGRAVKVSQRTAWLTYRDFRPPALYRLRIS